MSTTAVLWKCNHCNLLNPQNAPLCQACFRDKPKPFGYALFHKTRGALNVMQLIELLTDGYLRICGVNQHIIALNNIITTFYAGVDPQCNTHIGQMTIDCKLLNDFVDIFSTKHCVFITLSHFCAHHTMTSPVNDIVSFSLQSQETHHLRHKLHPHLIWDGNLISVQRNHHKPSRPQMYNIASNTMYTLPPFLDSDRMFIGCCASKRRGVFCIGGYCVDKDVDSVKMTHNITWSWDHSNPSKCTFGAVVPLAPYFHDTWCSTPLFIDNGNKVMNIGGGEGRSGHCSNIVGLYDFASNSWSRVADIPYSSQSSGAYYNQWDESVYVTGGYADRTRLCVKFSGHKNQWECIGKTNWCCLKPCVSVIDNVLVLVINADETYSMRMEYLDTRTSAKTFTVLVDAAAIDERIIYGQIKPSHVILSYRNICRI